MTLLMSETRHLEDLTDLVCKYWNVAKNDLRYGGERGGGVVTMIIDGYEDAAGYSVIGNSLKIHEDGEDMVFEKI